MQAHDMGPVHRGNNCEVNSNDCVGIYFRPEQCNIIACISMDYVRLYLVTLVYTAEVFDNVHAAFRLFIKEEGQNCLKDKKLE